MKTAEQILIEHVGKLALSGLKWKSLLERKERIIDAMTEYAAQEVAVYQIKSESNNSSQNKNMSSECHHEFENGIHTRDTCAKCGQSIYE